ncbi:uncharacterized protein LOC121863285 [Homarus americanus]|uniref:uncharacterized protein LOC121863285 n=1 Tax=Homarus americanus TaxID=6706 RepID=UPI001C4678D3|nr:uncharacterized protein LOC121863285 [Homarus americanus]
MEEKRITLPVFNHNIEDCSSTATDKQKYVALVCSLLPTEVATQVAEVITNPPTDDKFAALRDALERRYQRPDTNILQDLSDLSLGNSTPGRLWDEMQRLNSCHRDRLPDSILHELHTQKLPVEVRVILSALDFSTTSATYAATADRVFRQCQTVDHAAANNSAVSPSLSSNVVDQINAPWTSNTTQDTRDLLQSLHRRMDTIEQLYSINPAADPAPAPRTVSYRHRHPLPALNAAASPQHSVPSFCWYHQRFGANARHCEAPCNYTRKQHRRD